jgi:hypothetical protein
MAGRRAGLRAESIPPLGAWAVALTATRRLQALWRCRGSRRGGGGGVCSVGGKAGPSQRRRRYGRYSGGVVVVVGGGGGGAVAADKVGGEVGDDRVVLRALELEVAHPLELPTGNDHDSDDDDSDVDSDLRMPARLPGRGRPGPAAVIDPEDTTRI